MEDGGHHADAAIRSIDNHAAPLTGHDDDCVDMAVPAGVSWMTFDRVLLRGVSKFPGARGLGWLVVVPEFPWLVVR